MASTQGATRIVYGREALHFGELWLPQEAEHSPLLVFFHGGFWRARYDLAHARDFCAAMVKQGIAVWSVEYRRVGNPGGGWPGTFNDVLLALSYLPELAGRFGLDAARVVLCGHSAGGHLALWGAAQVARQAVALPGLCGVVGLAPVADLDTAWRLHLSRDAVAELLDGAPDQVPERYAMSSPASLLPLGIAQTLVHGMEDDTVPFSMSHGYVERADRLGERVTLLALQGGGHFDVIEPQSPAFSTVLGAIKSLFDDCRPPR